MKRKHLFITLAAGAALLLASCKKDKNNPTTTSTQALNPATAPAAKIDRFSAAAGHLQVRTASNGLPAANAAVDFDVPPFITIGLGPSGDTVQYYNFDLQPLTPAPIYVLYRQGETSPVSGQPNIIDVIPGSTGYNDFWQVNNVTVPSSYVANTITSYQQIQSGGYTITPTTTLVNCPIVPAGSTASKKYGGGSNSLITGWYKDSVVYYFTFSENPLSTNSSGQVPVAPIYVTFNINPDQAGGGPASGFKEVTGSMQTHNVIYALPGQPGYSPLWTVDVYDNASFNAVSNLATAEAAPVKATGAGLVNCPVVIVQ